MGRRSAIAAHPVIRVIGSCLAIIRNPVDYQAAAAAIGCVRELVLASLTDLASGPKSEATVDGNARGTHDLTQDSPLDCERDDFGQMFNKAWRLRAWFRYSPRVLQRLNGHGQLVTTLRCSTGILEFLRPSDQVLSREFGTPIRRCRKRWGGAQSELRIAGFAGYSSGFPVSPGWIMKSLRSR